MYRGYDSLLGRWESRDPRFDRWVEQGRANPLVPRQDVVPAKGVSWNAYAYANALPTVEVNPLGLVSWKCDIDYGTAGVPPGSPITGGLLGLKATCVSECKCAHRSHAILYGFGLGASIGPSPVGHTRFSATLEDSYPCPQAESLSGGFVIAGVGFNTFGAGYGASQVVLGDASSEMTGSKQTGFADLGVDWYTGVSWLMRGWDTGCCH